MPPDPTAAAASLFDRRAWRLHRERAARAGAVDFLHEEVADRLIDRLDLIRREFAVVLDLGSRDGALGRRLAARSGTVRVVGAEAAIAFLRKALAESPSPARRERGDRSRQRAVGEGDGGEAAAAPLAPTLSPSGGEGERLDGLRVAADPELPPFADGSFDLVISNLALHWVADLPGTLAQLRRVLQPDGLLLAAMLGGDTLVELRTALFEAELAEEGGVSPRVSPSIALSDAAALLQRAGYALPVADSERLTVSYPDLMALLHDLRGMGETNALVARRRGVLRRTTVARAAAIYAERFGDPARRLPATFEILYLCGWVPHAGQPQPKRRGSATARLADALRAKA